MQIFSKVFRLISLGSVLEEIEPFQWWPQSCRTAYLFRSELHKHLSTLKHCWRPIFFVCRSVPARQVTWLLLYFTAFYFVFHHKFMVAFIVLVFIQFICIWWIAYYIFFFNSLIVQHFGQLRLFLNVLYK